MVSSCRNGFEREVPDKIRRRFDYALDACNLSDHEKRFVKPFMAYGFDTVSIGEYFWNWGLFMDKQIKK